MVGVGTEWARLVDRYIDEDLGICLEMHGRFPSVHDESRDYVLVFQKMPRPTSEDDTTNRRARRTAELGLGLSTDPGADNVEPAVAVDASPMARSSWPRCLSEMR